MRKGGGGGFSCLSVRLGLGWNAVRPVVCDGKGMSMPRFLVIQSARLGDLVQTRRLLLTLAERGETHLAVDTGLVPLARVLYPFARLHALPLYTRDAAAATRQAGEVLHAWHELDFTAVYNCNFSSAGTSLCRLFAPELVHGYRPGSGGPERSPWARRAFRMTEHRACGSLNLVDYWGHFAPDPIAPERVNPPAAGGGAGLGVVLAGRESRRSLPVPLLARIVRTLHDLMGGPRVRLLGSAQERPVARRLLRELPARMLGNVEDLSGKTDLPALVEAVRGLDRLVTPDTGIMHLAAALGVPVLAFFLSSAYAHETGPYGVGHTVIQADIPCVPCLESAPCPRGVRCLRPFEDERLPGALVGLLQGRADAAGSRLPDGLQVWTSRLDALGCVLRLAAGRDAQAGLRRAARQELAAWLGLTLPDMPDGVPSADAAAEETVRRWLRADSDWMLPPRRYS